MAPAVSIESLRRIVPAFTGRRVLVLGDPVLDVYLNGTTHRISREAPVLIVREDYRETRLGGAANAAANLAALGASARFAGLTGESGADELADLFAQKGIACRHLLRAKNRHTITKTRVLAGALHTTKQQMLRIDRENDRPPAEEDRLLMIEAAKRAVDEAEALVVSDYGDGALSDDYAAIAREAVRAGKKVIVDSRFGLARFSGVSAVTPNEPEAAAALGRPLMRAEDAVAGAKTLLERLGVQAVILTRGREGMAVAEQGRVTLIGAHGLKDAIDVTGAGDTVTATFTLALVSGASVIQAAVLANCAASVTVQSIGAATLSQHDLLASIESIDVAMIREAS